VARTRGTLGAYESRLLTAISNLRIGQEQSAAAESRIRDADVAAETANLTRSSILQQAATAVLAQANQQPRIALNLLG
jgi:flagellin